MINQDVAETIAAFHKKKLEVMNAIHGLLKGGKNDKQNYKYVEDFQVLLAIRRQFVDVGLSFDVEATECVITHDITTKSGAWKHMQVSLAISLVDVDTGYGKTYLWYGSGTDNMDKAIYKAYTSGIKYWLLKEFLVPTANSAEAFNLPEAGPEPAERPEPQGIEAEFIDALWKRLVDSAPDGQVVSETKLAEFVWDMQKGAYPTDLSFVDKGADYIQSVGIGRVCVDAPPAFGPTDNIQEDFPE